MFCGYINNVNNFDYQFEIILIDKIFINQLNDKLLLLNGLLVLDVVLLIQDRWRSINLEAKPLSLYYLRVGHNNFSSPTTKACFLLPSESYFFLIYRYFIWLKNDFSVFFCLITWQLVETNLLTSFELSLWILRFRNF